MCRDSEEEEEELDSAVLEDAGMELLTLEEVESLALEAEALLL